MGKKPARRLADNHKTKIPVGTGAVLIAAGLLLCAPAAAQFGPATSAGVSSTAHSAEDMVRQEALAHGGSSGGCRQLPRGWAALDVVVNFPAAYAGYPAWVNSAELVPGSGDVTAYAAGGAQPSGTMVRPALRAGAMAVRSSMCAPAGGTYWLLVDSGMARVTIGRIQIGRAPGPYRFNLMAPPLQK